MVSLFLFGAKAENTRTASVTHEFYVSRTIAHREAADRRAVQRPPVFVQVRFEDGTRATTLAGIGRDTIREPN